MTWALRPRVRCLDTDVGPCRISDVRSQPADKDAGYKATERSGQGPDTAAIVTSLLLHRELIESCGMVKITVDNRAPEEVEHWPAFAQWWSARRALVPLQHERTDILWIQATHTDGLRAVPPQGGSLFTPLIGVPMENSLDLAVVVSSPTCLWWKRGPVGHFLDKEVDNYRLETPCSNLTR